MLHAITYFRLLARFVLVVYFLAAALFLGVRYWALPHIDHWRPQIAQQLSDATGIEVTLGSVSASWKGLNPSLLIHDISLIDSAQQRVLHLPKIKAVLSWRSLFSRSLQFAMLEAQGLNLRVRRDPSHKLWVMGQSFELDRAEDDNARDEALLQWVLQQRHVALTDAVVHWVDETRTAEPLVLRQVNFVFQSAADTLHFGLRAAPPRELGTLLDLRGQFALTQGEASAPTLGELRGQMYAHIDNMVLGSWSPWLDVPVGLASGDVSAQWWLTFQDGRAQRFTSNTKVRDAHWTLDSDTVVALESATIFASGKVSDYRRIYTTLDGPTANDAVKALAPESAPGRPVAEPTGKATDALAPVLRHPFPTISSSPPADIDVAIQATGLEVRVDDMFAFPMRFNQMALRAGVGLEDEALRASLGQVHLVNAHMDLRLQGIWRQGGTGPAGLADITGLFKRASLDAIDEYLPNTVDMDAREWLAKGLVDGWIKNARVVLKGDLEHFPWGEDPSAGDFLIAGDYVDGIIDYLPAEQGRKGWPKLTDMRGKVALHRVDLRLVADQARVWPTDKAPITLRDVRARIPNIEHDSVLSIQGNTRAAAQTYLALSEHSPLGDILDGQLNEAVAQGDWEVPLSLRIPLLDSDNTMVRGAIRFAGGSFQLMPEMPVLDDVRGTLQFSETGASTNDLAARFLGGPVTFSGGVGGAHKGLAMQGQIVADVLAQYVNLEGMTRFQGQFPYQLLWQHSKSGGSVFTLASSLTGLSMDLPLPWGKGTDQSQPLRARWARADNSGRSMALDVEMGSKVKIALAHRDGDKKSSYFHAGSIAVGRNTELPKAGMSVDVDFPYVDVDAWKRLTDEFSRPLSGGAASGARPLLPDVRQVHLRARHLRYMGLSLDQASLSAIQPEPLRWQVDIHSTQTVGTLTWQEGPGNKPGSLEARFKSLALGSADQAVVNPDAQSSQAQAGLSDDALDDVPAVDLKVDKFLLYGHMLGSLAVQGVNQEQGKLWRLEKFNLKSPSAELNGTGQWRLSGQNRGLALDAEANISDLGSYMDQLGYDGIVANGKGTIKGKFTWRNMPWKFELPDLSGQIDGNLEAGRFSSVSSRSARVLELLSLQSIQRLATLNVNPANLFKQGFPFDRLYGSAHIGGGIVDVNNYRVEGPAGSISLGGDVDLKAEKLNLQAMVTPNLDMSGATIAAGLVINPIVGIGAFLTQWLLRDPLSRAMSVHYHVSGDWDDPKLKEVSASGQAAEVSAAQEALQPGLQPPPSRP